MGALKGGVQMGDAYGKGTSIDVEPGPGAESQFGFLPFEVLYLAENLYDKRPVQVRANLPDKPIEKQISQ